MRSFWKIEHPDLGLVHVSLEPIIHPDAQEVVLPDVQWVRKDASGEIVDLCDHFPLHHEAYATRRDDPEVVAYLAAAAERRRRREEQAQQQQVELTVSAEREAKRNAAIDALIGRAEQSGETVEALLARLVK